MLIKSLLFVSIFAALPQLAFAAPNPKVTICHLPPGNPSNYQTITISSSALKAHLGHGDLGGACPNDCNLVSNACDDANLCTNDVCNSDGTCSHSPINCNDGNSCTNDTCNPSVGCVSAATVGQSCNDNNACTGGDQCNASGTCAGTAVSGCCLSDADCFDNDKCTSDTCNLTANTCSNSPKVCSAVDACSTNTCAPDDGTCQTAPVSCDDHNACTDDFCDTASGCGHTQIAGCCRSDADCSSGSTCNIPVGNSTGTCSTQCVPLYTADSLVLTDTLSSSGTWGECLSAVNGLLVHSEFTQCSGIVDTQDYVYGGNRFCSGPGSAVYPGFQCREVTTYDDGCGVTITKCVSKPGQTQYTCP